MADEPQPAEAQPAAAAKLPISARIFVDFKAVGDWGKLFDKSVTLLSIVEWLLKKAAARAPQGLIFRSVEACVSEEALARRGRELDNDDLSDITVATLYDHFGRFLKVFCDLDCSGGAASATPLPSGVNEIMETQRREPRTASSSWHAVRRAHRVVSWRSIDRYRPTSVQELDAVDAVRAHDGHTRAAARHTTRLRAWRARGLSPCARLQALGRTRSGNVPNGTAPAFRHA
jgi:hypothetical protein